MVQWLGFQALTARGIEFDPQLGKYDPTSHVVQPKKEETAIISKDIFSFQLIQMQKKYSHSNDYRGQVTNLIKF